jgi:hypothetical protein
MQKLTEPNNSSNLPLLATSSPLPLPDLALDSALSVTGLSQIEKIKEEISNHYVAALIYRDLEKNLQDRQTLVTEYNGKIAPLRNKLYKLVEDQEQVVSRIEELATQQQESFAEYQTSCQQTEAAVADLDRQISELQHRRAEILEHQEVRLKDQDALQMQLQNEIEVLQKENYEYQVKQQETEQQAKAVPLPKKKLQVLDTRIHDLVHHLSVIFASLIDNEPTSTDPLHFDTPSEEEAIPLPTVPQPLTFHLLPYQSAGQETPEFVIPLAVEQVILALQTPPDINFNRYAAEIYTTNGRRLWTGDRLEPFDDLIPIGFHSTFFMSEKYELRLRGRNTERAYTAIAEYLFRITKG